MSIFEYFSLGINLSLETLRYDFIMMLNDELLLISLHILKVVYVY